MFEELLVRAARDVAPARDDVLDRDRQVVEGGEQAPQVASDIAGVIAFWSVATDAASRELPYPSAITRTR